MKPFTAGAFLTIIARATAAALAALALGSVFFPWTDATAGETWIPIFNGKNLDGWHVVAKPEDLGKVFWKVQDTAITCDSRGQKNHDYVWLVNDEEYGDFELKLQVRGFRESTGNTGVQVRSRYDNQAHYMDGPQIDVHPPAAWRTGLVYDETREARRWIFPSLKNWEIDPMHAPKGWTWKFSDEGDGWNDLRIICRGLNITTSLNGVPAADLKGAGILDDENHRKHNVGLKGHIALQLHTRDDLFVQFKDILVRSID